MGKPTVGIASPRVCLDALRIWRHDAVAQAVARLIKGPGSEQNFVAQLFGGPGVDMQGNFGVAKSPTLIDQSRWPSSSSEPSALKYVSQIRSRADALCSVFVRSCSQLLGNRESGEGGVPRQVFAGSVEQYSMLLVLVETSLVLLHTHLVALALITDHSSAPTMQAGAMRGMGPALASVLGTSRLALVVQYSKVLRRFCTSSRGTLVAVPLLSGAAALPPSATRPSGRTLDLTFIA